MNRNFFHFFILFYTTWYLDKSFVHRIWKHFFELCGVETKRQTHAYTNRDIQICAYNLKTCCCKTLDTSLTLLNISSNVQSLKYCHTSLITSELRKDIFSFKLFLRFGNREYSDWNYLVSRVDGLCSETSNSCQTCQQVHYFT